MHDNLTDIRQQAIDNTYYRRVVDTGNNTQIVVMSIEVGDDVGEEVHPDNEQVLINASGQGKTVLNDVETDFNENDLVVVRPGVKHNFINTGDTPLKIITIYAPPHHPKGTIHKTKAEAQEAEKSE
jgi:mannose-6-phosphate isomerase-like protein (cupin superfamily)